ncbi:protein FAM8A1-like [Oppia nitens]|uniref:protein FAM8A1-like n=1 Tax=Oppia nitens TaxID=1686743 RepID=UPI0023D9C14F|nr:protein FAM8A1-like [Oppia nitens]
MADAGDNGEDVTNGVANSGGVGGVRRRRVGLVGSNESSDGSNGSNGSALPYKTCNEYIQHLNVWILQTMQYNWFAANYPLIMSSMATTTTTSSSAANNNNNVFNFNFLNMNPLVNQNMVNNNMNNNTTTTQRNGRVYSMPKLWKRIAAEVIDFCFLLILKLMVTYVAVDYLDLIDLDKFDLSLLDNDFDALQIAYELTSEIIIIEMIHRFIVCAYETICLYSGQMGREGGSTPGKAIFGISVVSCETIDDLGNGLIRVTPAKNIGLFWSLVRALIKNMSAVFFIPASLTVFLSPHNRAAYDILCKCVVVQEIQNRA